MRRCPSGDHAGSVSSRLDANRATPVPSAFMIMMLLTQYGSQKNRVNAILEPSGDHAGWPSDSVPVVRRFALPPSASITQILDAPPRTLRNAILLPSRDHAG